MKNFVEELKWRGMIHDIMPGTEEELMKGPSAAYVGIDPTGDSLHIGHLVSIMILKHFQSCGHKPYALVGGATGMIGDPSMKSQERNLLDEKTLEHNVECIKSQLSRFLDFNSDAPNKAELVNNYDWMKDYLYKHYGVKLQLGGADQWGNITTGTELIRRTGQGEAFALTCPLITKADGGKFGKTEKGNIWLDAERTSPYQFYQFWLNVSDVEAERYIKIFTMLDKQTIESAIAAHKECPEKRELQKLLAKEVTVMVHGEKEYETAVKASQMLFGKATTEDLRALDEKTFLAVFDGVPTHAIDRSKLPLGILDALAVETDIFPSKGEARKMIQQNGFSLNKEKMNDIARNLTEEDIIDGKYILVQKGKKDYHIIIVNG